MIASLSTPAASAAEPQTGLGIILTEESGQARIYPQRGSSVQVRMEWPLFIPVSEIESVVVKKRSSWNIISPVHTEYRLELGLRPDAAARLNAATKEGEDVRMGLLVGGEMVSALAFRGPITGRKMALYGFSNRNAAESLADEIKTAIRAAKR